jgi:stage III sporulation protein AG
MRIKSKCDGVKIVSDLWGSDLKQVVRRFRNHPGSVWLLLGMIGVGLLLMIGSDASRNNRRNDTGSVSRGGTDGVQPTVSKTASSEMERELARTLSQITGAGEVRVEISLKSANRKIWERQTRVNKRVNQRQSEMDTEESSSDELVFAKERDGSDNPVLKEELAPEIQGVLVVASGACDSGVKAVLTETVMTVLSLPAHRVMVIAGKDESK